MSVRETRTVPHVAEVVHYVSHGALVRYDGNQAFPSLCRAAIVAKVRDDTVVLCVLNPAGLVFRPSQYDQGHELDVATPLCTRLSHAGGTWHWPVRA
jgi:hypothetical protein